MERRLAAVLIADVVGYGRLSEMDEEGTRARFRADLKEIFEPKIAAYRGRLIKTMGDGLLVEFPSVVDALRCAVDVQQEKAEPTPTFSEQPLLFRIGINLGDIIVEGDDIHGDGVNIADRIQALAEPGGVAISGTTYDHVRAKLPVAYVFLGEKQVKSIVEPVRVYRVVLDPAAASKTVGARSVGSSRNRMAAAAIILLALVTAAWWRPWQLVGASSDPTESMPRRPPVSGPAEAPSIAVLPFLNMSDDKAQEFFVDGLTEDLILDLSNLSGLFVISRNSSFTYKNQTVRPEQVGEELGVVYVLNGSVRRVGDQVRITAQLMEAANGRQIWGARYDHQLVDIFKVQDEVKQQIISALSIELTPREQQEAAAQPTKNIEAYEFYLRGRYAMNLLTRRALRLAYYAFEQAIKLDPNFAEAHAALAMTYAIDLTGSTSWSDWTRSPGRARSQAELLAIRADALDATLAATELVRARLSLAEWRYDEAIAHARNALEREPRNADAHATLALVLTAAGRHDEAKQAIDEALRRDPKPVPSTLAIVGTIQFALREYQSADASLGRAFDQMIDGGNWLFSAFDLAAAAEAGNQGKVQDAREDRFWSISMAAVRFVQFYRNAVDMEHLLEGLKRAGVPEFGLDFEPERQASVRVTGTALALLLEDGDFETLCLNPRLNGQIRFGAEGNITWALRHDISDRGTSQIVADEVCVELPVMTRGRKACYSVFNVVGREDMIRDYPLLLAGPMLCYLRKSN